MKVDFHSPVNDNKHEAVPYAAPVTYHNAK